jgi:hypothetical protein
MISSYASFDSRNTVLDKDVHILYTVEHFLYSEQTGNYINRTSYSGQCNRNPRVIMHKLLVNSQDNSVDPLSNLFRLVETLLYSVELFSIRCTVADFLCRPTLHHLIFFLH